MSGSLVADLGLGPEIWVFLTLIGCLTLFFKFSRVWSVRNLDLLLLFALAPGMMILDGSRDRQPWIAFVGLFMGSALWLGRCLVDLGLARRPHLEPNLNAAGLTCLSIGILGLLLAETVSLPVEEGAARNPAESANHHRDTTDRKLVADAPVQKLLEKAPLPRTLKANRPQVIVSRILASLAHLGLVAGLIVVGWRHFGRPVAGLGMATCYLILPYTRIALVDSGQLVPASLIVAALVVHARPLAAGAARSGLASGLDAGVPGPGAALGRVLLAKGSHQVHLGERRRGPGVRGLGLFRPQSGGLGQGPGRQEPHGGRTAPSSRRATRRQLLGGHRRELSPSSSSMSLLSCSSP